jgi:hypothetical protein
VRTEGEIGSVPAQVSFPQLFEHNQGDRVQGNGARIPGLGSEQMELPRSESTWLQRKLYCSLIRIPV